MGGGSPCEGSGARKAQIASESDIPFRSSGESFPPLNAISSESADLLSEVRRPLRAGRPLGSAQRGTCSMQPMRAHLHCQAGGRCFASPARFDVGTTRPRPQARTHASWNPAVWDHFRQALAPILRAEGTCAQARFRSESSKKWPAAAARRDASV